MIYVRSVVFQLCFYAWTVVLAFIALPALILPFWAISFVSRVWSHVIFILLRTLNGLTYRIEGTEILPSQPVIFASKHQSAWDTMIFPYILHEPAVILKKELHWIPFYGWYAKKYGTIGIDRSGGAAALRAMLRDARAAIEGGRSIVVFPEGTRTEPGEVKTYQSGIAALYRDLDIPVVPVALNSGLLWSRRSILRKPGTITLRFLPAIPPGLNRADFMARLESDIETAQKQLPGLETAPEPVPNTPA